MRKILLGTTAVVGFALIGAQAQAQTAPTVRVAGYMEFTAGHISDNIDRAPVLAPGVLGGPAVLAPGNPARGVMLGGVGGPGIAGSTLPRGFARDKLDFRSDMEISVIVAGKAANGLEYGAEIELQMDGNNTTATAVDTDEMWMFFRTPTLGTLQFGDQDSAADQISVNGRLGIAAISGFGYSAQWDEWVMPNTDGTRYLLTSINDGNDATKIIYLSPSFFGFDFGISYAPNADEGEHFLRPGTGMFGVAAVGQRDRATILNEWSGGLRYRGTFAGVGVAASFSAMFADAQENNGVFVPAGGALPARVMGLQNVTHYEAAAGISAFGIGANVFYSWGKFGGPARIPLRQGLDNSTNWGMTLTYTMGPVAVGALYGQSVRDNGPFLGAGGGVDAMASPPDRKQTILSIGASFALAPGLALFANYTNVDDKNIANAVTNPTAWAATGRNRDIDVIVVGTRLTF